MRPSPTHLVVVFCLGVAAALSACPELPDSTVPDVVLADGETFVPLVVDRVYESVGEPAGGERVAIFGSGFSAGTKVVFGDIAALDELVLDDTQINVTAPPHAVGLVDVIVNRPDGQTDTIRDGYLYRGPIELASIAPAVSTLAGGIEVEVRGAGFDTQTRVLIGGRLLEGQRLVDAGTIRGVVPSCLREDAGRVDVIASNGFEQRVLTRGFEYLRALDLLGLDPVDGPSAGGTIVGLRGSGFDSAMVVQFGATPGEVVSVDPTGEVAEVRVPPGRHGTVDVEVSRGLELARLTAAFFYIDPQVVDGGSLWAGHAVPARGPAAGGNLVSVSVIGLDGSGGVTASFGGVPADVIDVRAGQGMVVVKAPPLPDDAALPADVQVVIGQRGVPAPSVTYTYESDFTVTAVAPDAVAQGGGDVALVGAGLEKSATVTIGGKTAIVKGLDHGKLNVRAPGGSPGKVDVEVVLADGRRVLVPGGLEYTSSTSRLWAVDPGEGAQSGGRIMRIFGEGFRETQPDPIFGETSVDGVDLVDDHLAIVRLPRGDEGHANVRSTGLGLLAMAVEYFNPAKRYGGTGGGPIPEALNVSVVDYLTGKGVANAFVILWDDLDTPYQGLTDDRGQITFSDVAFGPMQMATAGADNYTTATVCEFDARDVTLRLIPLTPSNPGGGGGGPGPQPLDPSIVSGHVSGSDKYIVAAPGSCDARLATAPGLLCQPCRVDADCGGGEDRCTDLAEQGRRCTTACETDLDCPTGYACAGVGGDAVQCIPDPGRRSARCQPTVADIFTDQQIPLTPTDATGGYGMTVTPGEYAIVCLGGYEDSVSGEFVPTVMGVRRHVFAQSAVSVTDQDVDLDVPLSRDLRIRLDGAPVGKRETELHTVKVYLNLGADGVYPMPSEGVGLDQNLFELRHFPVEFAESLYDATFEVYATAVPNAPPEAQTGEGSFVHYDQISQVHNDAVFDLDLSATADAAVQYRRTGIAEDVFAMHGPAPDGEAPARLWAVGAGGHVIAWDGTFWAIQQTPVTTRLRGVWAAAADDVWAVGEGATVVRWDGLRWLEVPMPAEVSVVGLDWWGVEGDGTGALWLWGSHGVWRRAVDGTLTVIGSELTPGSVEDIHAVSPTEAWLVGAGGLIRRWDAAQPSQLERWDLPGGDLHAVHGAAGDRVWAVGEGGRVLRWDGVVWFELLPVTTRGLHDVYAAGPDEAWATGDAGVVLAWDGTRWSVAETVEHADLRAIAPTSGGKLFAAGLATLVIGPFMQLPRPGNPTVTGDLLDLDLRWGLDAGADASFNWIQMQHSSGFPFWNIVAAGPRRDVPLPDLTAAWGLQPIWPGEGLLQVVRAYVPGFDMGLWDESILTPYRWRSWALRGFALSIPESQ